MVAVSAIGGEAHVFFSKAVPDYYESIASFFSPYLGILIAAGCSMKESP